MKRWKKAIIRHFEDILKLKTSPHEIALGFAVGTFIELLPTYGINIFIALAVVLLYKRISKLAVFFALLFWNPLFTIPIYILDVQIGNMIFGSEPVVLFKTTFLNTIFNFSRRYLVGALITSTAISIASYPIVRTLLSVKNGKPAKYIRKLTKRLLERMLAIFVNKKKA